MKKWQTKLMDVSAQTDVEKELNQAGESGWRFVNILATPAGVKFVLERQSDEDVDDKEAKTYELMKKFGV